MKIASFLGHFFGSLWQFLIISAILGVVMGSFPTLTQEILCDTFGMEKLTSTLGICLLFRGVAALAGAPIVGVLCNLGGTFSIGFYGSAALMLALCIFNHASKSILGRK